MTNRVSIDVRPLTANEWPTAMAVTARAFLHEPFIVNLCGHDLIDRYARVMAFYAETPYNPESLGALIGHTIVGCIGVESQGHCHHCLAAAQVNDPATSTYQRNATLAHLAAPPNHGWVGRVAVEPALHGSGIGGLLMGAALARLEGQHTPTALLDCEPHRVSYYAKRGFTEVDRFMGSFNNTIVMMAAHTGEVT